VLAREGQLKMLRLSRVRVVLCGSHLAVQESGGWVRELLSAHTLTASTPGIGILFPGKYYITRLIFAFPVVPRSFNCSSDPRMPLPAFLTAVKVQFCSEKEL